MNNWGHANVPFLFFTDFQAEEVWLKKLEEIDSDELSYNFNGIANSSITTPHWTFPIEKSPISIHEFNEAFERVVNSIKYGDSYLTNLTFETPVILNASLEEIFDAANAKYKLRFSDNFVCFSPETFISIADGVIRSFPMKGTINASSPDAEKTIMEDPKETAEHVTIVDLIRNDLSQVANNVRVERFRYIDEIKTEIGKLLQVSTEIAGDVTEHWTSNVGEILFKLLPAGSISGAPKARTIEIIQDAETHKRGFYTGVCGLFDGVKLDTGVMIRYIEKRHGKYYYKSGGGITAFSDLKKEYQEYQDKIYVPVL